MKGHWLFDIGSTYYYSTQAVSLLKHSYLARIIPDSFSGISMRCDVASRLYQPTDCEFSISNADQTLAASNYEGETVTVTLTDTGYAGFLRQWVFVIQSAVEAYGEIKCICKDRVTAKLDGCEFPKTSLIKTIFPSNDQNVGDDWRVPVTFGKVFIPIAPVLYQGQRHYLLGMTDPDDFTIDKIQSPREWDYTSVWTSDNYTFNQQNIIPGFFSSNACKVAQFIIADSDNDAIADANGVWIPSGEGSILCPFVKYTGAIAACGPGTVIYNVLHSLGVTDLDQDSFDDVDTALATIEWNKAFYISEPAESLVGDMLSNCDCYLWADDEVHLAQFSKTSVESLDKSYIIKDSYTISRIESEDYNGGIVKWCWPDEPQDILNGQGTCPLYMQGFNSGVLPTNPSTEVFEYRFETTGEYYAPPSYNAMRFGCLYFQRRYDQRCGISFKSMVDKLTTGETIRPGQVITINDNAEGAYPAYGASISIIINSIQFNYDLSMEIEGTAYNHIDDINSATNAYTIYKEVSTGTDFNFADPSSVNIIGGNTATNNCLTTEVTALDAYSADAAPLISNSFIIKDEAKAYATNLWRSLVDNAKLEPWGTTITENNTWTGDTGDFAITSGALTATIAAGASKSLTLDLSAAEISGEDFRMSATAAVTGTSASTYLRIKLTDASANVAYLYIDAGSGWTAGTDEYDVGEGETVTDMAVTCGLTDAITEIKIECACHADDTSIVISIDYLDIERHVDLAAECTTCGAGVDVGAYIVRTLTAEATYTPYLVAYDECVDGSAGPEIYFGPRDGIDPCSIPEQTTTIGMVNGPMYSRNAYVGAGYSDDTFTTNSLTTLIGYYDTNDDHGYFNETTGVFSPPYAGIYHMEIKVYVADADDHDKIRLRVVGTEIGGFTFYDGEIVNGVNGEWQRVFSQTIATPASNYGYDDTFTLTAIITSSQSTVEINLEFQVYFIGISLAWDCAPPVA